MYIARDLTKSDSLHTGIPSIPNMVCDPKSTFLCLFEKQDVVCEHLWCVEGWLVSNYLRSLSPTVLIGSSWNSVWMLQGIISDPR